MSAAELRAASEDAAQRVNQLGAELTRASGPRRLDLFARLEAARAAERAADAAYLSTPSE